MYVCLSENLREELVKSRRPAGLAKVVEGDALLFYICKYVKLYEASQMQSNGQIYICM